MEEFDAVEVKSLAKLGQGVGVVGVKEGVVVHVESQWEAVSLEDAGEEIEVGEEGFRRVEAGASVETRGVVEDFQEDLFVVAAMQKGVGRGVVLPECAVVAGLPAFDGFAAGFVTGVGVELMGDGPAADAGAVGLEVETAVEFAGDGAVRTRRFGGEEFGGQGSSFGGPVGMMTSAGKTRRPRVGLALSAGAEIIGAELVEAAQADAQFACGGFG